MFSLLRMFDMLKFPILMSILCRWLIFIRTIGLREPVISPVYFVRGKKTRKKINLAFKLLYYTQDVDHKIKAYETCQVVFISFTCSRKATKTFNHSTLLSLLLSSVSLSPAQSFKNQLVSEKEKFISQHPVFCLVIELRKKK